MEIKYKIWLDDEGKVFGEGPYQLLCGVLKHGSLSKAARDLNMSYSRAHGLMKKLSRKLGFPLLDSHPGGFGGGETIVTSEAKDLMRRYKFFMDDSKFNLEQAFDKHFPQQLFAASSIPASLSDFAFGKSELIALVGGGGKTSLMYALARQFASFGASVLVTTTTRIFIPQPKQTEQILIAGCDDLLDMITHIKLTGKVTAVGSGFENDKMLPIEQCFLTAAADLPQVDYIIVEADGAAKLPFKAPALHEPVIPTNATYVLSVAGLDALGAPLDKEHCHRPEKIAVVAGIKENDIVDASVIANVLVSPYGGRKNIPDGARWLPVINKVDDHHALINAQPIVDHLLLDGAKQVLLTSVKDGELKVISRCPKK